MVMTVRQPWKAPVHTRWAFVQENLYCGAYRGPVPRTATYMNLSTRVSRVKSFELLLLGLAATNLEEILIVNIYDIAIIVISVKTFDIWTCKLLKFLTLFGETASILFSVLISIFRYQKLRDASKRVNLPICMDSIRSAWMVSGVCVVISLLFGFPIFVVNQKSPDGNTTRNTFSCPPDFFHCSETFCPVFNRFYKYSFLLMCNMLPLIIVTATSSLIITVLLNQRRRVTPVVSVSGSSHLGRNKRKGLGLQRSTVAVLAAMGLFQVDWSLYLIFELTFNRTDFPLLAEMEFFISISYTSICPYVYGIGNNLFSFKSCLK
ncbi:hypothetical protein INR49_027066, partial [Caranx melampygus]